MTVIIGGSPGVGKTSQVLAIAKVIGPAKWASLELKDARLLRGSDINWTQIVKVYPAGHRDMWGEPDAFMTDPVATLNAFGQWAWEVISDPNPPKTIVIDGISDLRDYAIAEWTLNDNMRRKADNRPLRRSIGEDNLSAWGEINNRVKSLLLPIINYCQQNGVNLFMTSQMVDQYTNKVRTGERLDTSRWMDYWIESIIILRRSANVYSMEVIKVPAWAGCDIFSQELQKDGGLLAALAMHNLLVK